ncbi:MAG: hypothetical protein MZV63_63820 [Marinilabiliales bacterium]|nr:hypothetical protein [Marinilabiliales bacterium]
MRDPLMDLGIMSDTLETAVTWENLLRVWSAAHEYVNSAAESLSDDTYLACL